MIERRTCPNAGADGWLRIGCLGLAVALSGAGCDAGETTSGVDPDAVMDAEPIASDSTPPDGSPADAGAPDGSVPDPDSAVAEPWQARLLFEEADGLNGPDGLFALADGRVLVANEVGGNVLRLDIDAEQVEVVVPAGAPLSHPEEVAVGPDGAIWVSDDAARAVFRVADGVIETVADADDGLRSPEGIAVGPDGTAYIADEAVRALFRHRPGDPIEVIADADDGIFAPEGLALAPDGTLYATDDRRGGVIAVDADGPRVFLTPEQLALPEAVAVAPDGTLWFTDNGGAATVQRFTADGEWLETIELPLAPGTLAGICAPMSGRLVVSVYRRGEAHEIWVVER